jgi:DNA-binding PadR family transcriptional regulator
MHSDISLRIVDIQHKGDGMNATYAISDFPARRSHALRAAMRAMAAAGGGRGHGRHRHHRGDPRFHMHFGGPAFGFGGPPFGGGRGRKARRGDVRTATLLLLSEGPRNGYQIMQDIEERSGGVWRPSPGSVYPVLQQLEDEGLIRSTETDGRKHYELTDAGRDFVAERGDDAPPPWEEMTGSVSDEMREVGNLIREVALASSQVLRAGSPSQIAQASKILTETRRSLYRILADGEPPEDKS